MSPKLAAIAGPLAGQTFLLGRQVLTIGRDRANSVQLRDPAVSRQHCVVEPADGRFRLRDLTSRSGTFVNNLSVRQRILEEGDRISLGSSIFLFQQAEPSGLSSVVSLDDADYVAESTVHLAPEDSRYLRLELAGAVHAEEARTARDLHALLRIANALNALRSTEQFANSLLEMAIEIVPAERTALLLFDRAHDLETIYGLDRQGGREPFTVSRTLVQRVTSGRSSILSNDVLHGAGWDTVVSLQSARIRSLIAVPLTQPEGLLGMLYLDTCEEGVCFDETHLELLTAAGSIAAVALATIRHIEWLREENQRIEAGLSHEMVGTSESMRKVYQFLARVAPTESTVLLLGESGTGKELAALALHRGSLRADKPFVAISCAAIPDTLLESELFGHEKGAFTGALARKPGKFEVAHTGTVFLDEIGELPLALQAKLLRAIQERKIERVGGTQPIHVDLRFMAATNRDLKRAISEGTFREDLYHRLNVIPLTLPPLRERREDILLLAKHFLSTLKKRRRISGFSREAQACLLHYDWPGNVRELRSAIEHAIVLGDGELIRAEDLPESVLEAAPAAGDSTSVTPFDEAVNRFKERLILDAVKQAGGNITSAAEALGRHPNYLHRLITKKGLRDRIKE
ncbi:MAG TPA: sigma 54-interacting transcriptional regulator [Thermoanaerobaculia bacterium]